MLREAAEHRAEERVAPGGLPEGARVCKQPRDARLAPCRVEAVDEVGERIHGNVLRECHSYRELARMERDPPSHLVVRKAEERSVHRVNSEPCGGPGCAASDRLPEHGDVRVVAAKESLVQRLLEPPQRRGRSPSKC